MYYRAQVLVVVGFIFLMLYGGYCGIAITLDGAGIQRQLCEKMDGSLVVDNLALIIQYPTLVQASGIYTTEIHIGDAIEQWRIGALGTTEFITLSMDADPRQIRLLGSTDITIEVPATSTILLNEPLLFAFVVRNDVKLPDSLEVEYRLVTKSHGEAQRLLDLPVYRSSDFVKKELGRLIFFSLTAVWVLAMTIVVTVILFELKPIAGGIFLLIVLIIAVLVFPPIKQAIEIIGPLLKMFPV